MLKYREQSCMLSGITELFSLYLFNAFPKCFVPSSRKTGASSTSVRSTVNVLRSPFPSVPTARIWKLKWLGTVSKSKSGEPVTNTWKTNYHLLNSSYDFNAKQSSIQFPTYVYCKSKLLSLYTISMKKHHKISSIVHMNISHLGMSGILHRNSKSISERVKILKLREPSGHTLPGREGHLKSEHLCTCGAVLW